MLYLELIHVSFFSEEVEKCQSWSNNVTQQIDLAFNIFFMVYFFIRVSIYELQYEVQYEFTINFKILALIERGKLTLITKFIKLYFKWVLLEFPNKFRVDNKLCLHKI